MSKMISQPAETFESFSQAYAYLTDYISKADGISINAAATAANTALDEAESYGWYSWKFGKVSWDGCEYSIIRKIPA